jgi:rod shape-determining protein MreB
MNFYPFLYGGTLLLSLSTDMGIDLGTANTLIYMKDKGIVLREPFVVAIKKDNGQVVAVGNKARRMIGRTPGNIVAIRPLREGVIADYSVTERMLRYFIPKPKGIGFFFRPRVMICIPAQITNVEERAIRQAAIQAGAGRTYIIKEPVAAALGAGLNISAPSGTMVVDIGGGTTDIAVLSLNGIVCSKSLRVGGDKFDEAIARYIRKSLNLYIGERTSEKIKMEIGVADKELISNRYMEVHGRSLINGLPKAMLVYDYHTHEAFQEPLEAIIGAVKEVLENTPPELAADVVEKGITLTGGGSLLKGIDTLLSRHTGIKVLIAEDPLSCVALGAGKALNMLDLLSSNGKKKRPFPFIQKLVHKPV